MCFAYNKLYDQLTLYIMCDELSDVGCAILELKFTGLITIALQMKTKTALQ